MCESAARCLESPANFRTLPARRSLMGTLTGKDTVAWFALKSEYKGIIRKICGSTKANYPCSCMRCLLPKSKTIHVRHRHIEVNVTTETRVPGRAENRRGCDSKPIRIRLSLLWPFTASCWHDTHVHAKKCSNLSKRRCTTLSGLGQTACSSNGIVSFHRSTKPVSRSVGSLGGAAGLLLFSRPPSISWVFASKFPSQIGHGPSAPDSDSKSETRTLSRTLSRNLLEEDLLNRTTQRLVTKKFSLFERNLKHNSSTT